jgi:hypothetical protein
MKLKLLLTCATWFCASAFAAVSFAEVSEINQTTSRYLRTKYMCKLATEDDQKPLPTGLDFFRMNLVHYGIADLYGDGSLDMFFGFSDDTYSTERVPENYRYLYEGNSERSRKNHQYSFYSTDENFVVPDGTKYLIGRSFAVQDYNGDKVDDYVVAQWGTDYPPQSRRSNEVLLSSKDGYTVSTLPGGPGYNHTVTSGDIDEDGDSDVIVGQPTTPGKLLFYKNDGFGSFSLVTDVGIKTESKHYDASTVALWDIDDDGYLDLVVNTIDKEGGDFEIAAIYWGKSGFSFSKDPSIISISDADVARTPPETRNGEDVPTVPFALDFDFAKFTKNSGTGIAAVLATGSYSSWSIFILNVKDREVSVTYRDIKIPEERKFFIPWISACDLQNDGDIDIVYDHFGQIYPYGVVNPDPNSDVSRLDKFVWENTGSAFKRHMLESSAYFDEKFSELLSAYANSLGVSSKPYTPTQSYFPNTISKDRIFLHPGYAAHYRPEYRVPYVVDAEIAAKFSDLLKGYGPQPSVAKTPSPYTLSPRVREILEKRKQNKVKN